MVFLKTALKYILRKDLRKKLTTKNHPEYDKDKTIFR
jgi:hypothetical protein